VITATGLIMSELNLMSLFKESPTVVEITSESVKLIYNLSEDERVQIKDYNCSLKVLVKEEDEKIYRMHAFVENCFDKSDCNNNSEDKFAITVNGLKPGTIYSFKLQPVIELQRTLSPAQKWKLH
jgi:hypothetical protein